MATSTDQDSLFFAQDGPEGGEPEDPDTFNTTPLPESGEDSGVNTVLIWGVLFTVCFFGLMGSVAVIIVYLVRSYR